MKPLDNIYFSYFNSLVRNVDVGDNQIVEGRVDLYGIRQPIQERRLSNNASGDSSTELSGFSDSEKRNSLSGFHNVLPYLTNTLNLTFSDYDFSSLDPSRIVALDNLYAIESKLSATLNEILDTPHLFDFTPPSPSLHNPSDIFRQLWGAMDEELSLSECECFSYIPEPGNDPLSENGVLWSLNYFFINKRLKKLAFLMLKAYSRISSPHMLYSAEEDDEMEFFGFEESHENFRHADDDEMDGEFML